MKYYHGTDIYFKTFDISQSGTYKDFGIGMYLSERKSHAETVALWKRGLHAFVFTYDCNLTEMRRIFNILEFKTASENWLKFVISNRCSVSPCDYDIVIGPTADASAQILITDFIKSHPNPTTKDYNSLKQSLKTNVYPCQVCLKSLRATQYFDERRIKEERLK